MRITRWIFLIAGILGLIQASPIIYALISSGGSVLPDESILSGYILVSILQYLAWQLVYLLISNAPTRHRLMMIPAIAAALTESFLSTWIYFYGAKLWFFDQSVELCDFDLIRRFILASWQRIEFECSQPMSWF